jgi:trimeric autotransporter adhesin
MTGSNDTLNMASNTKATVTGTGDTVDVTGTGAKLRIDNATIYVESGADVTVAGTGDTIIHGSPPAAALSAPAGAGNNTIPPTSSSQVVAPGSGTVTSANATPSISTNGATSTNNSSAVLPGGADVFNGSANHTTMGTAVGDKITTLGGGTHVEANGTSAVGATSNVFDRLAGSSSGTHDGSSSPILLTNFNRGAGTGVTTPLSGNILLPQAQQLINAMASFAPPDAAPMTAIVNPSGGTPVVLAANLH